MTVFLIGTKSADKNQGNTMKLFTYIAITFLALTTTGCFSTGFENPFEKQQPRINSVVIFGGNEIDSCLGVLLSPRHIATSKECAKGKDFLDVNGSKISVQILEHPTEDIALLVSDAFPIMYAKPVFIAEYEPNIGDTVWIVTAPNGNILETEFDGNYNNEGIGFDSDGHAVSVYGVDAAAIFDLF